MRLVESEARNSKTNPRAKFPFFYTSCDLQTNLTLDLHYQSNLLYISTTPHEIKTILNQDRQGKWLTGIAEEENPTFFNELMRYVAALVQGKESNPSLLDSFSDQLAEEEEEEEVKRRVLEMEKRCL